MASKLRRARKIKWSKRLKTHGFMIRMLTKNWRNVLKRRREKGRHQLTPQKTK